MTNATSSLLARLVLGLSVVTACDAAPEPTDPVVPREAPVEGALLRAVYDVGLGEQPDPIPWFQTATVSMLDVHDPSALFTLRADVHEGVAEADMDGLPEGAYRVAVHVPGYLAVVSEEVFEVQSEDIVEVDLTQPGAALGEDATVCEDNHCRLRAGDLDRSGTIDEADLELFESPQAPPYADLDGDGEIGTSDRNLILDNIERATPDLTQIYEVAVPAGHCAVPSSGLGESYPPCLTVEWDWKPVNCDHECAEYAQPRCAEGCAEGLTCADASWCDACVDCGRTFLKCRQACRSVYPYG